MYILVLFIHVIVCLFLIIVVLLQSGKAADLAGAFGGMGSQTAFGPRGSATLLSKATTASAILFMITSLTLSIMATRRSVEGNTILENHLPAKTQSAAPQPGAPPQPGPASGTVTITPSTSPIRITPGTGPAQPGQPSVTLTDPSTGATKTVPLNIPSPPGNQQQAPPKK